MRREAAVTVASLLLSLREKGFVEAARAGGARDRTIIFRERLPNLAAPIVVYSTLVIPQNILLEAALSFLGVGINPPQAKEDDESERGERHPVPPEPQPEELPRCAADDAGCTGVSGTVAAMLLLLEDARRQGV
jgi:hypothetical protein